MALLYALPGAVAEGLIWGLMAIGVYISYKILDIADLTVDGSICTGGCVCAVLLSVGVPAWVSVLAALLAGMLCGGITGLLHLCEPGIIDKVRWLVPMGKHVFEVDEFLMRRVILITGGMIKIRKSLKS